ncbi:MAG: hypothetical protein DWQ07_00845 [Chloroflexi bacterium]|nr:MAG: hypothetical protein DWQ07_00845 [Chloroflexota bacterium]MBL1195880.1 hypothetical protein [Chloroflexota bacterium]NOH13172.1 hypothetical protein [Chloroflexota bacterium]
MTRLIDPQHLNIDEIPGIWTPVNVEELSDSERVAEVEDQARASLLAGVDTLEAVLRLLLHETEIQRAVTPPDGYDPELQGEWDSDILAFEFKRGIKPVGEISREAEYLFVQFEVEGTGEWIMEITPEKAIIEKL